MVITVASTTKTVTLQVDGAAVPARIWEGHTDSGIPVHCYLTRIAVRDDLDRSQFEAELLACRAPSAAVEAAIPNRLIL
jgi:hypothetical protein